MEDKKTIKFSNGNTWVKIDNLYVRLEDYIKDKREEKLKELGI